MPNAVAPPADEEAHADLTTFQCREAYVYKIPPASTIGHRAELWMVDDWLQEVSAAVVTSGDDCWVRLFDKASAELFAECPLPQDKPLVTVVEPVVDSSRYFVMRIVDRASQRHAFIGMGFRERNQASDFNAALDDHLQYLRRKKEAARMKAEYTAAAAAGGSENGGSSGGSDGSGSPSGPARDLALKPGETITVALPTRASDGSATTPPTQRMGSMAANAQFNLFSSPTPLKMSGSGAGARGSPGSSSDGASPSALLPPPPPPRFTSPPSAQQSQQQPSDAAGAPAKGDATAAAADLSPAQGLMAVSPKHPAREEGPGGAAGSSRESFHARFDVKAGMQMGAFRVAEALGPRSMRVSICIDDDGASDAASLANLSMKAHTSGSSSLAGSATYSDGGNSEAAADEEAEAHRAAHAAACDAAASNTAGDATAVAQAPKDDAGAANAPISAEVQQAAAHGRKEEGQAAGVKDEWGDFVS